jgi:hypothetical protein
LAVPRSMPISLERNPRSLLNMVGSVAEGEEWGDRAL